MILVFECDMPENVFFDQAKEKTWEIKKITKPVEITRYTHYTYYHIMYESNSLSEHEKMKYKDKTQKTIKNGYYYRTPPRDNGGKMEIGYDSDTGMVYYNSTPW